MLLVTAGSAPAGPADLCQVGLPELSGLASDGARWYAVNDSDNGSIRIQVLGRNCAVQRTISAPVDPFDVEDLARAPDGTLWLADTGDNGKSRATVALHAVAPGGTARLFRLTYPDAKHDAEALLLDRRGRPYVITKEPLGPALVYRPVGELTAQAPTPLEQVGSVSISSTDTPGGPLEGSLDSRLVTGAASSVDGSVVALRTYTDAYLFPVPEDGDLVKALKSDPVRVPLPNEPQGEAIAFEPDGSLLSASEGVGSPVRAVAGAAALVLPPPPATTAAAAEPRGSNTAAPQVRETMSIGWPAIAGVGIATVFVLLLARRVLRRR